MCKEIKKKQQEKLPVWDNLLVFPPLRMWKDCTSHAQDYVKHCEPMKSEFGHQTKSQLSPNSAIEESRQELTLGWRPNSFQDASQ